MRNWYHNNELNQHCLPPHSRKMYTKDDWSMFLAAAYYDAGFQQHPLQPLFYISRPNYFPAFLQLQTPCRIRAAR